MKPLICSLFKRNALVALAFLLLLTGRRLVSWTGCLPPWWITTIAFFCCLLWANGALFKSGRFFSATLLSLLLVPLLGFPVCLGSFWIGRSLVEWQYQSQDVQLVGGCNLAAANDAQFDLYALAELLAEATNAPVANTNRIYQLRQAYALAQERARLVNEDCSRRGHRDSHPWKTNWGTIKQVLAAPE